MLELVKFQDVDGWADDNLAPALEAFQRSAQEILENGHGFKREARFGGTRGEWQPICEAALKATNAQKFFETHFAPLRVHDKARPEGLFTGYYEPETPGSLKQSHDYPVPIYAKPDNLITFSEAEREATGLTYGRRDNGKATGYLIRKQIEEGALAGKGFEICFVRSWVDAFFMHVQGNGRVVLEDGRVVRLSYAAKNGQAYTGIGSVLLSRGVGTPQTMSMQLLRQWMGDNPSQMRELLWSNNSFVFFRVTEIENPHLGAIGAAKVSLTPMRSLAIDRSNWMFGTPLFIDTHEPPEAKNGPVPFRQLMIGQDTGTAIRGLIRGDVYWGWGEMAALNAGHMKSKGAMTALLPKALAQRLVP